MRINFAMSGGNNFEDVNNDLSRFSDNSEDPDYTGTEGENGGDVAGASARMSSDQIISENVNLLQLNWEFWNQRINHYNFGAHSNAQEASHLEDIDDFSLQEWIKTSSYNEADNDSVPDLNYVANERSTPSGDELASADNAWMNDQRYEASGGEESLASSSNDVQVYSQAIHHDPAYCATKLGLKIKVPRNTVINESITGDYGLGLCKRPPPVVCQERGVEKEVCINGHTPAGEQTRRTFTYHGQDIPTFGNNLSISDTVHMIATSKATYSSNHYEPMLFPTSLANSGPHNVYSGPNRLFNADDAYSFAPMSPDVDQNSGSNSQQSLDESKDNYSENE